MCQTKKKVRLQNVLTKKQQEFNLIYHTFKTKAVCAADRESTLAGD